MAGRFRVKLWDIDTAGDRDRNTLKAVIDDAKDIGVSAYANQGGEMFFTIPWNHPAVSQIVPYQRHYEVSRMNSSGTYDVVGVGLLDDYDSDENEVVAYGSDYLSLFDLSISGANTTYTSNFIGTIITTELSAAIFQPGFTAGDSVTRHITLGHIDATTQTVTVLTSFQPRLQFIQQLIDIWQSDSSVRPIIGVTRDEPFTVSFSANSGVDQTTRNFEWGGLVNGFRYKAGFGSFGTRAYGIGQKREGASVLFSIQSYANLTTYGLIQKMGLFIDIVNQAALDRKVKRLARRNGQPDKNVALALRVGQLGPWEWGGFGDSVPVKINRGLVQLNSLYTVWGQEWTGNRDGSEDLFLSLALKET